MTQTSPHWHQDWFDEDYLALYGHRDAHEAQQLVLHLRQSQVLRSPAREDLVLDLGCGAGRHALELAKQGYRVVGLDWSPVLLRRGLATKGPSPWPCLVRGDLASLPLREGCASLVLSLFTSQGYHPEDCANALLWLNMLALVAPGGRVVLDFLNPAQLRSQLVALSERQLEGLQVREECAVDEDLNMVVKRVTISRPDGRCRHIREAVKLYDAQWFLDLARKAGFQLLQHWGSLGGEPWCPEAPRSVLILERST